MNTPRGQQNVLMGSLLIYYVTTQVQNDYDIVAYRTDIGVSKLTLPQNRRYRILLLPNNRAALSLHLQIQKDIEPNWYRCPGFNSLQKRLYSDLFFVSNNKILKAKEKPHCLLDGL